MSARAELGSACGSLKESDPERPPDADRATDSDTASAAVTPTARGASIELRGRRLEKLRGEGVPHVWTNAQQTFRTLH